MSALQTFRLYDHLQQPLTGQLPTFRTYFNQVGTELAHPVIFEIGLGKYGFNFDDPNTPRGYQVDGGVLAVPRYLVGANAGDCQAFGIYNVLGVPTTPGVGSPNFLQYCNAAAVAKPQPTILQPAAVNAVYFFIPTPLDISEGRSYVIRSDSNNVLFPPGYEGTIGNLPTGGGSPSITNVQPPTGSGIGPQQVLSFDVIDPVLFRRILICADFGQLGLYEVIHDGESFSQNYGGTGNARSAIVGGFHYTVLRKGGWPASPRIIPFAEDTTGAENP